MMVHTVPEKQKQKLFRPILVTLDDQERERGGLLFCPILLSEGEVERAQNFRARAELKLLKSSPGDL